MKTCDYCKSNVMCYTFLSGETVCNKCLVSMPQDPVAMRRQIFEYGQRYQGLKNELEEYQLKLAACGVAAMQNTSKSIQEERLPPGSQYWSASYGDVCAAVDREIALREHNQILVEKLKEIMATLNTFKPSCWYCVETMAKLNRLLKEVEGWKTNG